MLLDKKNNLHPARQARKKNSANSALKTKDAAFMERSSLYREFIAEREEILRHKWLESEKAGYDIGFEKALLDWIRNHRDKWRSKRRENKA